MNLSDLKTIVVASSLCALDFISQLVVGALFLLFDLTELNIYKEYVNIIVWFFGAVFCLIYLAFRALDMYHKSSKSKLEKEILEFQKKSLNKPKE